MPVGKKGTADMERETNGDVDYLATGEIEDKIIVRLANLDNLKLSDEMIGLSPVNVWSRLQRRKNNVLHETVNDGIRWNGYPTWGSPGDEAASTSRGNVKELVKIFSNIVAAARWRQNSPPRVWSARFLDKAVPHNKYSRKPHLVLMNRHSVDDPKADWSHIFSVVECKFGMHAKRKEVIAQLAQSVRLIFGAQPDRRFVLGIGVCNDDMALCVFNRGGLLCSDWFNVHQSPVRFIRIVAGLTRVDREGLGFDPTMDLTTVDAESKRTVTVNGNVYNVDEIIHHEDVIRGRATLCLKVNRDGKTRVVKNAWVDTTQPVREPEVLEHLSGIKGVPGMIEWELITIAEGRKDNTLVDIEDLEELDPKTKVEGECEEREQVRVVLSEFVLPLREFKSKYQLLDAFLNIAETLEELHERGVLHRDISERNIMLGEDGSRLIDYDYALLLSKDNEAAVYHRTGTLPFMAFEILDTGKKIVRRYDHDLESIFYVMCYIFTTCSGPRNQRREDFKLAKSHIGKWFGKEDEEMVSLAWNKRGHVFSELNFREGIIDDFDEYFSDDAITKCMEELRTLLFQEPFDVKVDQSLHDAIMKRFGEWAIVNTARKDRNAQQFFKLFKDIVRRARDAMIDSSSDVPRSPLILGQAEGNAVCRDIDGPLTEMRDVSQHEVVQSEEKQGEDREKAEDSGIEASVSAETGFKRKSEYMKDSFGDRPFPSKKRRTGSCDTPEDVLVRVADSPQPLSAGGSSNRRPGLRPRPLPQPDKDAETTRARKAGARDRGRKLVGSRGRKAGRVGHGGVSEV